jgi:DNA-3-methyladenine glycosylase
LANQLQSEFFLRPTLTVARELLGKTLVRVLPDGTRLSGIICETEAYIGQLDLACHAKAGRTARTQVMFGAPGFAYVYFTYGKHWLLNIVTEAVGFPAAVLLRAIVPVDGVEHMQANRQQTIFETGGNHTRHLTDGPAKLTQALQVNGSANGWDLCQPKTPLWLADAPTSAPLAFHCTPRIGLGKTPAPWVSLCWRFVANI